MPFGFLCQAPPATDSLHEDLSAPVGDAADLADAGGEEEPAEEFSDQEDEFADPCEPFAGPVSGDCHSTNPADDDIE